MHCFSGSLELAEAALEMGFYISFSGVITFPKAERLREIAMNIPSDRLLIETDCPYLAPIPYRGHRNEPAYVVEVARRLAGLRDMTCDEMGKLTSANFTRVFGLKLDEA